MQGKNPQETFTLTMLPFVQTLENAKALRLAGGRTDCMPGEHAMLLCRDEHLG